MKHHSLRLAGLVAILFAFAALAVGCGGAATDTTANNEGGLTKDAGVLSVGSDIPYAPIEFGDPPDYEGFDVDLVGAIAEKLGVKAEFTKTPFDTITRDLAQGKFDMVASAMTITPERAEEVTFSDPYFAANQALAVTEGSDIESADDLAGGTVAAQLATTGESWARENLPDTEVRTFDLVDDALQAVNTGQVDAAVIDFPVVFWAEEQGEGIVVAETIETDESYGMAFADENTALLDKVNEALAELKKDGTYSEIYEKWFHQKPPKELLE